MCRPAGIDWRECTIIVIAHLTDLPMLWSEQWRAVGLQEPIQA
jgi:hypothetical protein